MWRRIIFGMEAVTVRGLEDSVHSRVKWSLGGDRGGDVGGVWLGEEKAEKCFRLHQCKGGKK